MPSDYERSQAQSKLWAQIGLPIVVAKYWPGGRIIDVETDQHPACLLLDRSCGIDYLIEHRRSVIGLAWRGQAQRFYRMASERYGGPTFTIRTHRSGPGYRIGSEFNKTLEAVRLGTITAAWQYHAYMDVDTGPASAVVAWGLAHRARLFEWIEANPDSCHALQTRKDAGQIQEFIAVKFDDIPDTILVEQYPRRARQQALDTLRTIAGPNTDQTDPRLPKLPHPWQYLHTGSAAFIRAYIPDRHVRTRLYRTHEIGKMLSEITLYRDHDDE